MLLRGWIMKFGKIRGSTWNTWKFKDNIEKILASRGHVVDYYFTPGLVSPPLRSMKFRNLPLRSRLVFLSPSLDSAISRRQDSSVESIGALTGELMEDEEGAERKSRVFAALKTYCTDLLELLRNPKHHCPAIPALLDFLRCSSSDDLQPFFE